MTPMLHMAVVASLALVMAPPVPGQDISVLHIRIVLVDAGGNPAPVPRHALLISANPANAAPRLIVTRADGTADVRLRAGNYTVESDRAVAFHGHTYQWTQTIDVVAGRDAVLELTAANADAEPADAATSSAASSPETDPLFLLPQWQGSVVAVWSSTRRGSGFVIGATGLIATNQRIIGSATSAEIQLTPALKVEAQVLAADPLRDVAILRVDPAVAASVRPVPLPCTQTAAPLVNGQEIFTIGVSLRQQRSMTSGTVSRVDSGVIVSDLSLAYGSAGGPVFTAGGEVAGITSFTDESETSSSEEPRIVPVDDACHVIADAEKKMKEAAPPGGAHLPVEPARPFPLEALEEFARSRTNLVSAYQMSSSTFDVAFITPPLTYGARYQSRYGRPRTTSKDTRPQDPEPPLVRPLLDFANWSEYTDDFPPVLLIRVTPRMVEGFWTRVARGAAQTAGIGIPPIKRITSGFSRLRALCGDVEVTPIHPFKLEHRISRSDTIHEGLYVFDPGALGPHCGTVKLVLFSEKAPRAGDTRIVDPGTVEQIWQDFAPYRTLPR